MMREIKFRAWDSKAKAMFPVHEMKFDKIKNQLNSIYGVDIYDKDSDYYGDVAYGGSVHKKTGKPGESLRPKFELMQFTGLKDRNGKEIYEGDIIKGKLQKGFDYLPNIGVIRYSFMTYVVSTPSKDYLFAYFEYGEYEVIGNIYENEELLEDK